MHFLTLLEIYSLSSSLSPPHVACNAYHAHCWACSTCLPTPTVLASSIQCRRFSNLPLHLSYEPNAHDGRDHVSDSCELLRYLADGAKLLSLRYLASIYSNNASSLCAATKQLFATQNYHHDHPHVCLIPSFVC